MFFTIWANHGKSANDRSSELLAPPINIQKLDHAGALIHLLMHHKPDKIGDRPPSFSHKILYFEAENLCLRAPHSEFVSIRISTPLSIPFRSLHSALTHSISLHIGYSPPHYQLVVSQPIGSAFASSDFDE
jgi:hypothetical protein